MINNNIIFTELHIVFHFPNYMNSMLCLHPIYVQLLSLIDIGLHIQEKHFGFPEDK